MAIRFSKALPVQFWLTDEESFNEKDVCGVESVCWCQPWHCDDPIPFQFEDDGDSDYSLSILEDGVEIENIPFIKTSFGGSDEIPESEEDMGLSHPDTWDSAAGDSVRTTDYTFIAGRTYTITLHLEKIDPAVATNRLFIRNSFTNDVIFTSSADSPMGGGTFDLAITFVATDECNSIRWNRGGFIGLEDGRTECVSIEGTMTVPAIPAVPVVYSQYDLQIIPNDYNLCGKQVQFKYINDSNSPANEEAHSDCQSIQQNHPCTLLIAYSNASNYAGLFYEDASPSLTFYLRIPAIFFEEEGPQEHEDIELSDETIVRLYDKLESQRKLDIGFMPFYMHTKLKMALSHDFVTIDEKEWTRREAYNISEGNRHYPLRRANVLLNDKNFIKENQL